MHGLRDPLPNAVVNQYAGKVNQIVSFFYGVSEPLSETRAVCVWVVLCCVRVLYLDTAVHWNFLDDEV